MFIDDGRPLVSHGPGDGGSYVVRVRGEIDVSNADVLRAALESARQQQPARMVVDLSETAFLDATAAGWIDRSRLDATADGHQVVVRNPPPIVRRLLHVLGFDGCWAIEDDLEGPKPIGSDPIGTS